MESLYSIGGLSTHPPDKSGGHRTSTIGGTVKKVQRQYVVESQLAVTNPFLLCLLRSCHRINLVASLGFCHRHRWPLEATVGWPFLWWLTSEDDPLEPYCSLTRELQGTTRKVDAPLSGECGPQLNFSRTVTSKTLSLLLLSTRAPKFWCYPNQLPTASSRP